MDKEQIIKAIDKVISGLIDLKKSLGFETKTEVLETKESSPAIDLLANRLAYAYTTIHPEWKIDNQITNLTEMVKSSKITYIIAWLKKGDTEGMGNFFDLSLGDKRALLQKALTTKDTEIRDIFKKRFGHDD